MTGDSAVTALGLLAGLFLASSASAAYLGWYPQAAVLAAAGVSCGVVIMVGYLRP